MFVLRVRVIVVLLLVGVVLCLGACAEKKPAFNSVDLTGVDFGKDFQLTDHTGKPRSLADYRGKVVALFFGYTQCPDVCPTTMSAMAQAMKLLGDDAAKVQVLFVTLDPERDTPQLLAQYVPQFNPGFIGLYGDAEATRRTAAEFRIIFDKRAGPTPTSYTLDHTAGLYVIDAQGRMRLFVRHGEKPEVIAADIRTLLAGK